MKILLYPNLDKESSTGCMEDVVRHLLELNITPMIDQSLMVYLKSGKGCITGYFNQLVEQCDMIMPLGGDGTLIQCAQTTVEAGKPIIGVNTGRVGFLTQLEACELEQLSRIREGSFTISERMMLAGRILGEDAPQSFYALNDIVISRTSEGIADIQVEQGERLITRQRGDGLIFSTPTGSTGYSLSAGGPIVDPELELILLTSICPHAVFRCSMALPPCRTYTAREHVISRECGLVVTADGRRIGEITSKSYIEVKKHQHSVKFVELGVHDFYDNLSVKLSWNRFN